MRQSVLVAIILSTLILSTIPASPLIEKFNPKATIINIDSIDVDSKIQTKIAKKINLGDKIIVFTDNHIAERFVKILGDKAVHFTPLPIVYTKNIPNSDFLGKIIEQYSPYIKYIGENRKFELLGLKRMNISDFDTLSETSINAINATPLLNAGYTGKGIRIAVIDSGINPGNELGNNKIVLQKSFVNTTYGYPTTDNDTSDGVGHGTYVAIVAAANGTYTGVAPQAEIINAKVFYGTSDSYVATEAGIIAAIIWCVNEAKADVINMSLGGPAILMDPLLEVVKWAVEQGVIVVIAAGNEGESGLGTMQISTPGTSKYAITVGATNEGGTQIAYYSSIGPIYDMSIKPDVVAPGVSPIGLGTSFASPHVAGAVALLLDYLDGQPIVIEKPIQLASLIKTSLMMTAKTLGAADTVEGAGLIDVGGAWQAIKSFVDTSKFPDLFSVLPKKLPAGYGFPYYSKLFLGMNLVFNFTLYTSINRTVSIELQGNISDVFKPSRLSVDISYPFTNWEFNYTIPTNATTGFYSGTIVFKDGSRILSEVRVQFSLEQPAGFILFDLRHTSWVMDAKYGQYREYFKLAEENDFAVEQVFWSGRELTDDFLRKYDLVFIPDAASYYTIYDLNGTPLYLESKTFTKSEIKAIKNYVDTGGAIIFIAMDPTEAETGNNLTNINEFAKEFGVNFKNTPKMTSGDIQEAEVLDTPLFGLGGEILPYWGVSLTITDTTRTSYFLRFRYIGSYYGGALYVSDRGGFALLLATNFFFDNWAFNGRYGTSSKEAENVRKVHQSIFNNIGFKKHIIIQTVTQNPKLGEEVTVNISIVDLSYSSLRVFYSDLIGKVELSYTKIGNNSYQVKFLPRHAQYVYVVVEVELENGIIVSKSHAVFIEPLEWNKPILTSAEPENNSLIRTDLHDAGILSFSFNFTDDSKLLYEPTSVTAYVVYNETDLATGTVVTVRAEAPVNYTIVMGLNNKSLSIQVEIAKPDIVNIVSLARELKLEIEINVYDINGNLNRAIMRYSVVQSGVFSLFDLATVIFVVLTLIIVVAILLKFRRREEPVYYVS